MNNFLSKPVQRYERMNGIRIIYGNRNYAIAAVSSDNKILVVQRTS